MSRKSNIESCSESDSSRTEANSNKIDNEESELMIVYDLDLDFEDCYLLGLPKLNSNVFEEMKMLEELDLDFEDLVLLGGLPKFENTCEDLDIERSNVEITEQDINGN